MSLFAQRHRLFILNILLTSEFSSVIMAVKQIPLQLKKGGAVPMPKNMEIALLFDFYGEMLTEKQRRVVEMYYEEDLSLAEIAESQNITRQGVRDSIKRAEAQMLEMEDRLQLTARFRDMRDGFANICRAAYEIQVLNDRYGYSREVDERAKRIIALAEELKER